MSEWRKGRPRDGRGGRRGSCREAPGPAAEILWDAYRALMVPLGRTVDTDDFCMMISTGLSASSETSTVT